MEDRHDLDKISADAIHDSIVPVDDFTKGIVTHLGHDPSGQRARLQALHRGSRACNEEVGRARRVPSDISSDCFDVLDGQR